MSNATGTPAKCDHSHVYTTHLYVGTDFVQALIALLKPELDYDRNGYVTAEHTADGVTRGGYCRAETLRIENTVIVARTGHQ